MPSQYRALWSVPGGGQGYSVFHAQEAADTGHAQSMADNIRQFFFSMAGLIPDDVIITFDSEVLVLDDTGTLLNVQSVSAPTAVSGSGGTNFGRALGARVDWLTGAIVAGRRLRGRTYIVPLEAFCFGNDGLLTPIVIENLNDSGQALVDSMDGDGIQLQVWSRTHAFSSSVSGVTAPAKGAVLTSRRD
jgi:hypothetical protein